MDPPASTSTLARDPGFSLIELLVVVLILGVLAAIAIPSYLRHRERARETGQKADARSLAVQMETYYVDERRYPTPGELSWLAGAQAVQFTTSGETVRLSEGNRARVLGSGTEQRFCIEVRNAMTRATAVYTSGGGGLQVVEAGASCPADYDSLVLAYPPS